MVESLKDLKLDSHDQNLYPYYYSPFKSGNSQEKFVAKISYTNQLVISYPSLSNSMGFILKLDVCFRISLGCRRKLVVEFLMKFSINHHLKPKTQPKGN
jgi:hypothetical protein